MNNTERWTAENIYNSERAYQVLRFLHRKDGGSYATEISNELDLNRPLVSELLSRMTELDILEKKEERTKKQYYQVKRGAFEKIFFDLWEQELESRGEMAQKHLGTMQDLEERLEPEHVEAREQHLPYFLAAYVTDYCRAHEESTMRQMAVEDFFLGLTQAKDHRDREDIDFEWPEWLDNLYTYLSIPGWDNPYASVSYALDNYKEIEQEADED